MTQTYSFHSNSSYNESNHRTIYDERSQLITGFRVSFSSNTRHHHRHSFVHSKGDSGYLHTTIIIITSALCPTSSSTGNLYVHTFWTTSLVWVSGTFLDRPSFTVNFLDRGEHLLTSICTLSGPLESRRFHIWHTLDTKNITNHTRTLFFAPRVFFYIYTIFSELLYIWESSKSTCNNSDWVCTFVSFFFFISIDFEFL